MTTEQLLRSVMDRWKAGIDAREPDRVAALFSTDAVFQGLRPYTVGRTGVATYYDSQPLGMTVDYRVLETRRPTNDVVLGYLAATFAFTDRPPLELNIGVVLTDGGDGWHVAQYQAASSGRV
ncbi:MULTISPECIES: hypothetical protein [unclassified Mycobacterium]|uniref:hypothetical protein n=1 Tax=unclassified Mycobacterium TaxID=2642494 RepID=UPI0029C70150|nr:MULTISPECIES: hypothetical protein [unclassified Mycobacterium]